MANKAKNASPAWITTFADLMALMMTFFVLLFSFSSIDEQKYRMIAESMAKGFGSVLVQARAPKATLPGPPAMIPSPMNQVSRPRTPTPRPQAAARNEVLHQQLLQSMQDEIADGIIDVETRGNSVVIRFPEAVAFPPGSDQLSEDILPILERLSDTLQKAPGSIQVSGHTDDRPIRSADFSSNWELSTDRAVQVINRLEAMGSIPPDRLTAVGYGRTRPLVPNDSADNRARNRRVEISITLDGS